MFYFKKVEGGVITSVEAKSANVVSPDFVSATKQEYDAFIASLPTPEPEPVRDLATEIDEITARLDALGNSPSGNFGSFTPYKPSSDYWNCMRTIEQFLVENFP